LGLGLTLAGSKRQRGWASCLCEVFLHHWFKLGHDRTIIKKHYSTGKYYTLFTLCDSWTNCLTNCRT